MTTISVIPPFPVFFDTEGEPLESGLIYIGSVNQNPLILGNQIAAYTDAALTNPVAQPISTIGGYPVNSGTPIRIYVNASDYSILVLNKNGELVHSSPSNKTKLGLIDLSTDVTGLLLSTFIKYDITIAEITAGVTPTSYYYPPGDIRRYGAVGDGAANDTPAIQAAADVAEVFGGEVNFPPGKYKIMSEIVVSSTFPVALIGYEGGCLYNAAINGASILIGANIAGSWIKYTAPNAGVRAAHGGGTISGLTFVDPTGTATTVGTRTCTAALELNDFAASTVDNCVFQWINGSAIKGEFVVMTSITNNRIRYCGAVGKPALNFPSTIPTFPAQSLSIIDNRVEVCYSAAYISVAVNGDNVKIIGNGFEADTTIALSNQLFVSLASSSGSVIGNHFNRNTGTQVSISGSMNAVNGNTFQGGVFPTTAMTISGAHNAITGNTFRSGRTGYEVDISGVTNTFNSNALYISGAVRITGAKNVISGNTLDSLSCTTAVLGAGDDFWISDAVVSGTIISNNVLTNNGGTVFTLGGIRVKGVGPLVQGNFFDAFNGAGNGAICIRCETANASIGGNTEINSTTIVSASSAAALAGEFFSNFPTGASLPPLTGSVAFDPPNLADGAGTTTTVAVTGALLNDFAQAGFSLDLQGITVTAWVSVANTVSVRFQNESGVAIDLGLGTLKAKVTHR